MEFMSRDDLDILFGVLLAVMEPIDKLSARMQHLDSNDHTATEMLNPNGPRGDCRAHMYHLLYPEDPLAPERAGVAVNFMRSYYTSQADAVYDLLTDKLLDASAQFWARVDILLDTWPWQLLRSKHDDAVLA
eukprot:8856092-Pyramimonas_sp.AAC.1